MKDQKNVYEKEFFVLWWIDGLPFDRVVWLGKTYPGIWPAWSCGQAKHNRRYDLPGGIWFDYYTGTSISEQLLGLSFYTKDLYLVITQKLTFVLFMTWCGFHEKRVVFVKSVQFSWKALRFSKDHLQGIVTLCFILLAFKCICTPFKRVLHFYVQFWPKLRCPLK